MMKRKMASIAALPAVITMLAFSGLIGARAPAARSRTSSPELGDRGARGAGMTGSVSGRQLFLRSCAGCHGSDARGKKGPALAGRSLNQEEIEEMVGAGQPPRMPAFGSRLSLEEIKAIAAYVRSLGGRS
jgi:mono/diheme cytochrome c family protein